MSMILKFLKDWKSIEKISVGFFLKNPLKNDSKNLGSILELHDSG